jgi:hypothetical protein
MITWKFENSEIKFVSAPHNLDRDISKMAYANHIDPSTKIILLDGINGQPNPAVPADSNGDTSCPTVEALSVDSKKTKPRKASAELRDVSGDLAGNDNPVLGVLPTGDTVADSSASDWFSNE